ncbi:MAG: HepT-like ribonuclease domain-containing protein [Bryobacteraceae bacterium]
MPSKNPEQRLRDILENVEAVSEFISSMDFETFRGSRQTIYAVTRALEIISEASRRLPDDFKTGNPHLDWVAIAAAGNVYRHEYDAVDHTLLWHTATRGLADLERAVVDELQRIHRFDSID